MGVEEKVEADTCAAPPTTPTLTCRSPQSGMAVPVFEMYECVGATWHDCDDRCEDVEASWVDDVPWVALLESKGDSKAETHVAELTWRLETAMQERDALAQKLSQEARRVVDARRSEAEATHEVQRLDHESRALRRQIAEQKETIARLSLQVDEQRVGQRFVGLAHTPTPPLTLLVGKPVFDVEGDVVRSTSTSPAISFSVRGPHSTLDAPKTWPSKVHVGPWASINSWRPSAEGISSDETCLGCTEEDSHEEDSMEHSGEDSGEDSEAVPYDSPCLSDRHRRDMDMLQRVHRRTVPSRVAAKHGARVDG